MTFPPFFSIDALCVTNMQRLKHSVKPFFCIGHENQMNMIGHQAIRQDIDLMFLTIFFQLI